MKFDISFVYDRTGLDQTNITVHFIRSISSLVPFSAKSLLGIEMGTKTPNKTLQILQVYGSLAYKLEINQHQLDLPTLERCFQK